MNSTKIIDLNDTKTTETIYKNEKDIINHKTGEVISQEQSRIVRERKKERFIKVFVDNLDYVIDNFSNMEKNVFLSLLKEMNYYNVIKLDSGLRKTLEISANISQGTVSKTINKLIEKNAIIKINETNKDEFGIVFFTGKEYVVNPQLVGSGSFKELSRMRRVIVMDYDFEKLESSKEIQLEVKYDGFDEVYKNPDKHEIAGVKQTSTIDGKFKTTEVAIREKQYKKDDEYVIDAYGTQETLEIEPVLKDIDENGRSISLSDRELDLAIKNAENEQKKLENENLRMKIELIKLQKENK